MIQLAIIYFVLPDGRWILQRRDQSASTGAGLLGFFGGHIEEGETPARAVRREIAEETSLEVGKLQIQAVADYRIAADANYPHDRHTFIFKAPLQKMDFEVFEGERAEAYSLEELRQREDITAGIKVFISRIKDNN